MFLKVTIFGRLVYLIVAAAQFSSITSVRAESFRLAYGDEEPVDEARSVIDLQACRRSFRIALDVGHSRSAPGAISARGRTEYEFNTALARAVLQQLNKRGYAGVKIITSPGGARSLERRAEEASAMSANLLLSIHHDSVQRQYLVPWSYGGKRRHHSDRFRGYSLFVSKLNIQWEKSLQFARLLSHGLLKRGLHFTRHHAEDIPGERRTMLEPELGIYQFDELVVLKYARIPAILLEAGVIVNRQEEQELQKKVRRDLVSSAIADATDVFCVESRTPTDSPR